MDGTPLGRYRLIELLGRGGMGEVWRAYDTATERLVAVKVLPAALVDDQVYQQRFRREAKAAAGLDEPHVVPIYDFGEIEGRLYVTMRLVKGQDLQGQLDSGPLKPERAVNIIEQIASALHAAHKIELVHRDVKPSNILVTDDDFAYLIDFGIARAAGEVGLTSTGTTVGTWAYMSPERFRTGEAHAGADVYALACVLFECLTGEQPYPIRTLEQIAVAHMMEPPPRPSARGPGVPAEMDQVIATGMAKDPEQRYATTKELAQAARAALTAPIHASPAPPISRPTEPAPNTVRRTDDLHRHGISPHVVPAIGAAPTQAAAGVSTGNSPTWQAAFHGQTDAARAGPPAQRPGSKEMGRGSKIALTIGAIALAAVVVAAIAANIRQPPSRKPAPTSYSSQVELPFPGLSYPMNVAVDNVGDVYVSGSDPQGRAHLRKLAAGSTTPTELPITGLVAPVGMAFDNAGNLYLATYRRILKVAAGSTTQTVLLAEPSSNFGGFSSAVAVDSDGNVYVCRNIQNEQAVLKISAGSTTSTTLPFTGLKYPSGVAVDAKGNVYVTDADKNQVLELPAGAATQVVLPIVDLNQPAGVALDAWSDVYIASSNEVLRLAANSSAPGRLPFAGVKSPTSVAVDKNGNVYIIDGSYYLNSRVIKLPAH